MLSDDTERESEQEIARDLQARWRCPAAGKTPGPLDPADLDPLGYNLRASLDTARRLAGVRTDTCPLAEVEDAPPMLTELAIALASVDEKAFSSVPEALDRPLTAVEHHALTEMLLARRARRQWEHENPPKKDPA
jgi:hypothetical protein